MEVLGQVGALGALLLLFWLLGKHGIWLIVAAAAVSGVLLFVLIFTTSLREAGFRTEKSRARRLLILLAVMVNSLLIMWCWGRLGR